MFEIITSVGACVFCERAKNLLTEKGLGFGESPLDTVEKKRRFREAGFKTVPQIYHNGNLIGGYDELVQWLKDKDL